MKNKKKFSPVLSQTEFVAKEKKWLKYWYKEGIVDQYLHRNDKSKKTFSFFDGPITANNPMGVHHAWGRTLKDLFQRYKNMRGFKQRFQNGFDCQGLWVEVEVEKDKGFHSKKDIEKYGIAKFVKDCKARVEKYSTIQTKQSQRLGYFMDWNNSYYTMSEENNYTIWHFLKKCQENGLIYQGEDAVPWCPRCGTAISQHEIDTEGYKDVVHQSVFMRFPVIKNGQKQPNEFLLVWTTTPWTIPANTLVAVHPKIEYSLVNYGGKRYWLAKNLVQEIFKKNYQIEKTINGKQLIEKEKVTQYEGPFDDLPIIKKIKKNPHFHQVVLGKNLVNEEEGTGLVHIVPGAGMEDHALVKKELGWDKIIFPVVDEAGAYIAGYGELSGQNAKEKPALIINALEKIEKGRYFFKSQPYHHSYPTCWRCKTELIWRLVNEWYIAMDKPHLSDNKTLRERMITIAKQINWQPEFGLNRELDWLGNMHDWLISKKRYWGLALPIWQCPQCHHFTVIGGREELKKKAISGWNKFNGHTPHRPWIDEVEIKCPQCGAAMKRIRDVGNPWLDAGIISFSTLVDPQTKKVSYLDDQKYWRQWYPADFITECFPGQFRNWFYSLIAMAAELENTPPFKNVLGHGLVKDEKGEEMHKSKGNTIWFDEAAEKMGVDVMRWLYLKNPTENNINFGYQSADKTRRQFHLLLWNIYRFFVTYANLSGNINIQPKQDSNNVLDKWILSKLNKLIKNISRDLDQFQSSIAIEKIENFVNDLSLWYLRRSRQRMSPENPNRKEQKDSLNTLYYILLTLTKILAPFTPFLAEEIYQNLSGQKKSVHWENWPSPIMEKIDPTLEKKMKTIRAIVSQSHSVRKKENIRLRQPLQSLKIKNLKFTIDKDLLQLTKEEINVKEIIEENDQGKLTIILDTKINPKLKAEGEARDIMRKIQQLRKKRQLQPNELVTISLPSWPKDFEKEIKEKTSVAKIKKGKELAIIDYGRKD